MNNDDKGDYPRLPVEVLELMHRINVILAKSTSQLVSFTVIFPGGMTTHVLAAFEEGVKKPQYQNIKAGYVRHLQEHAREFATGRPALGPSCEGVEGPDNGSGMPN